MGGIALRKGICIGCLPAELGAGAKLALAREAGFDGVEVNTIADEQQAQTLRTEADRLGLALHSVMDSLHWQCPLSSNDEATRRKGVENVRLSIRTAQIVGADAVLVVPGVVNERTTYEDCFVNGRRSLEELLPAAEEAKVRLCLENVWNKWLLSPVEFRQFVDSFQSDYVQAYFDVGNIVFYGFPQHWIRTLGPTLRKVHVKGFDAGKRDFCWLLEGTIGWPAVIAALRDVGYDGYVTAEMPTYPSLPDQAVRDIAVHLDRILGL